MVIITYKPIQANPDEVLRARGIYPRKVEALPLTAKIAPENYALIQESDKKNPAISTANTAIFMAQQFNGLEFFPMIQETVRNGLALSTPRRIMQNIANVNSAKRNEMALYDALGNIIEGDKLIQYVDGLNYNRWVYLNGRFPQEKTMGIGHRGLDFVTINADGSESREPLKECLDSSCYAELGSINEQGFPTRRASVQKYQPGETIYFYPPVLRKDKPEEGYVARLGALPVVAWVLCLRLPGVAVASLGGISCAEGAVAKNREVK